VRPHGGGKRKGGGPGVDGVWSGGGCGTWPSGMGDSPRAARGVGPACQREKERERKRKRADQWVRARASLVSNGLKNNPNLIQTHSNLIPSK
jgi:hypothetical protein